MKVKKVLFYAAPVALAGFLYLGEATGIGEVLAKTVKTVIQTEVEVTYVSFMEKQSYNGLEYSDGDYIYKLNTQFWTGEPAELLYRYDQYSITKTETEIQTEVPDDSQSSDVSVKVVPTVDPEAEAAQERARQEAIEKAREEAAVKVQKEAEQKTEDFAKEIAKMTDQAIQASAKAGEANGEAAGTPTAVIKTDYFTCFTQEMLKQLAANPNVNYEIHYRYQGKRYVVVIPAGTDYSQLKDSNGYYGFRYLDSIFGGYEEGTK